MAAVMNAERKRAGVARTSKCTQEAPASISAFISCEEAEASEGRRQRQRV